MIKGMYDAPKIAVRVGNEVSNSTEYLCGVRQGCPASPILFDFYINDIFKGVRSVRVPGLTSRIPGLLLADNDVLLAESSVDLQIALNTITEWSDTWEMAVNATKCEIITISGELTTDITLQGQKVSFTDQYTYLGYIMNSKLDVSGTIKNNNNIVRKSVYAAYSFLRRSDVLTALKIKFINSVLKPIGCYGGETFGMSEARCKPIKIEIDKVIRIAANVGKSAAMERIRDELGTTPVFMRTSTARERAYHKWPTSKTWIADLINAPMKARMAIWVTWSAEWVKKFLVPRFKRSDYHHNCRPKIQNLLSLLQPPDTADSRPHIIRLRPVAQSQNRNDWPVHISFDPLGQQFIAFTFR
ncbi:RNA-directed DNA polymerase from mobile element jockey [Smittium culicis]|uniref:RNA-directed DNA polymerase from mobile element jockey n=1 Tax=Smittium culicis TaxID=133412 RepID=A0A1R1X978_9FUNG|nr:RNA-directed DNA polymerase from mobile element jockey [Smittium culicis]